MKMRGKLVIAAASISLLTSVCPAVAENTAEAEESAFRQAIKFGFSGEAIQGGVMIGNAPNGTKSLVFDGNPVKMDDDGKFIIAFNRDAGQTATLVATLQDGRTVRKFFNVSPRKWKIQHVALNRKKRTASAAYKKRRAPELAQINAARSVQSDSKGWRQDFVWPVKGRISGMFGHQRIYNGHPGGYHTGIDIAAPTGTHYVAPADGSGDAGCDKAIFTGRQSVDDRPWNGSQQRIPA